MDRIDVELFLAVVKWNSITKASEIMHFSQPTVSYRLKLLEKEMGVQLFHRHKGQRTSELTQQGEQFIDIAERWLALYQDTQELKHYPSNMLNIAAISSISSPILTDIYTIVSQPPFSLRLNIITKYSEEIYNLIEDHSIDIGFIAEPYNRKNVVTIPLFFQEYYVAHFTKHPDITRKIKPDELDPHAEVYLHWCDDFKRWHQSIFGDEFIYQVSVDNVNLLPYFLTTEGNWAFIPSNLAPVLLARSHNIQIDELDILERSQRTCYMVKHKEPRRSKQDIISIFEKEMWHCFGQNPNLTLL